MNNIEVNIKGIDFVIEPIINNNRITGYTLTSNAGQYIITNSPGQSYEFTDNGRFDPQDIEYIQIVGEYTVEDGGVFLEKASGQ